MLLQSSPLFPNFLAGSSMFPVTPLMLSHSFLAALGTQVRILYPERVPTGGAVLVVSNHRSFMDAPLLMAAVNRPVRFACHHYMSRIPLMREVLDFLGCFPLDTPKDRGRRLLQQVVQLLQSQQVVGIFPEGAASIVRETKPTDVGKFQRGFAHLALRAPIQDLVILPVAIAACQETTNAAFPLRLLSLIDPSEPLFDQPGWHPLVVYHQVNVLVGRPYRIQPSQREDYHGKQAQALVNEVTEACQHEVHRLLKQGFY